MPKLLCVYRRVSTDSQKSSGLGLLAQQSMVDQYIASSGGTVIATYEETESGKNNRRPLLKEALNHCKLTGATLVIANISRLTRSVYFLSTLMESNVDFVACDNPHATKVMLQLLTVIAEDEVRSVSQRTKAALQAAKVRGPYFCEKRGRMTFPLGYAALQNLTPEGAEKGRAAGLKASKSNADAFASNILPVIDELKRQGATSYLQLAGRLNEAGILTARKKKGAWTAQSVKNCLARINNLG